MSKPAKKFPCPRCARVIEYSLDNEFRPFCSERCKTLDIASWADENYRIASHEQESSEEEASEEEN